MADERLRELERIWKKTLATDDARTYLRERVRVLERPADQLRLDVLEYDPARTRSLVTDLLEARVRVLELARVSAPGAVPSPATAIVLATEDANAWKRPLASELDARLETHLGSWFEGMGRGFGGEGWCQCHSFFGYQVPPRSSDVPEAVSGVIAHLDRVHGFTVKLLALFSEVTLPLADAKALEDAIREAVRRIVALVVLETGCDDAWYVKPQRALELLLADKDVHLPDAVVAGFESSFSGNFRSWISPTSELVLIVADEVALAIVRARFEARYGSA